MIEKVIQNFGESLGIKDLKFNNDKVIHLTIENVGDLFIEDIASHLLVYMIKELKHPSLELYKKALTLCHYREKKPYTITPGLMNDNLLTFTIRLDHEDITAEKLSNIYDFLESTHQKAQNA